jgi:high-affinity nickel permease
MWYAPSAYDQPKLMVGLWFSLGHSTIVIVVNIAIAISVQIYDKLDGTAPQEAMGV